MPDRHPCAWCQYPNAKRQGGFKKPDGTQGSEWFCDKEHFELWLNWQAMLSPVRKQTRITKFTKGPVQA